MRTGDFDPRRPLGRPTPRLVPARTTTAFVAQLIDKITMDAVGVDASNSSFCQVTADQVFEPHVAMTVAEEIDVLGSPQIRWPFV